MSKVTFKQVCEVFDTLEGTSSRNDMAKTLSDFYKNLNSVESEILSYLILGRVAPFFVESEFNYSEKGFLGLLRDLAKTQGIAENVVEKRKELGDIGDTLEYFSKSLGFKSTKVRLLEIYNLLWEIVNTSGEGSVERKNKLIVDILSRISPLEAKYFSRIICGSLRLGLNAKTLLDVFSVMVSGDKSLREELDRAYGAYADIGYICSLVSKGKTEEAVRNNLASVEIQPGIPVLPRLVERVGSFEEVFERLGEEVLVQTKYDGLRCQIHKFRKEDLSKKELIWLKYLKEESNGSLFGTKEDDIEVKLFTRNLEDVTGMFPEIVEGAKDIKGESFIMDSEVLGFDPEKNKFLSFQDTMQRRRKYDVTTLKKDIPVKAVVFDVMYLNKEGLLGKDTIERIEILERIDTEGGIQIAETLKVKNVPQLREIFDKSVKLSYEGLIVKQRTGAYLPGTRNFEWIKLKKSMLKGLVDSIDLVAVGYNLGSGRRKDLGVGSVLGAIYDQEKDYFVAICNVGTGFKDEQLSSIAKSLEKDSLQEKPKNIVVEKGLEPDVWVDPKVVFTVEADEISKKKDSKYLSLRFPRLIEWGRDKDVTEATTLQELEKMYKK